MEVTAQKHNPYRDIPIPMQNGAAVRTALTIPCANQHTQRYSRFSNAQSVWEGIRKLQNGSPHGGPKKRNLRPEVLGPNTS
jgi:hypothetical protein